MNTMKTYKTSDLNFAAFLKTARVPYKGTESTNGRRYLFVFEDNGQVESLKHAFISRSKDSQVVALTYADELKALKAATKV